MTTQDFSALLQRTDVKTIAVHDNALTAIHDMLVACEKVAQDHGFGSDVHRPMVESLHKCLNSLFSKGFGNHSYVTKEADLSLYVQDGDTFVYGIVFHRDRKWDNPPAGHQQPGTWSTHS